MAVAGRRGERIQLISRSDSTLRGHVMAEVAALDAVRREVLGRGFDAVLLVPAFLEAGRLTAGDVHWARTDSGLVAVGETEFARDPAFGYRASNLRDFVAEKAKGGLSDAAKSAASAWPTSGLAGLEGPVTCWPARDGAWVVVNATEYSDLETVACGVLQAERAGKSFLFRAGPSFVRALAGIEPKAPLRGNGTVACRRPGEHGLIVVGSHVARPAARLPRCARAAPPPTSSSTSPPSSAAPPVTSWPPPRGKSPTRCADPTSCSTPAAPSSPVQTRRTTWPSAGKVSAALSRIVREALAARPAWILAKGGITSHDVALHGLGIRRAEVAGQLFPGMISVFRPIDSAPEARRRALRGLRRQRRRRRNAG